MHVVLRKKSTAETQTDHRTEQNKKKTETVRVEGMKKCSAEKKNIAPPMSYYHTITCNCLCCDLL